ncbi:hypothetical protein Tco_1175423 [Tanacetum coccineum]
MTYEEPTPILIEKAKVTRYTVGPGETYTKIKVLGVEKIPRTRDNVAAMRARLMKKIAQEGNNQAKTGNELKKITYYVRAMETLARHATVVPEITSGFTITIPPPPPFFNPLPQQATPTPTPITSEATTSFPSLLDFSSVFKFNDRVTNLEKDLSEIKQVDQYAQAFSSIPAIVDCYIDNRLVEAINKAIHAHNLDCR